MFKRYLNNEKGFSMIEMMVVLIIIAVLIAGGIKFYLGYIENSRVTKAKAQIMTMQAALDAFYAESATYPTGAAAADLDSALINAGIKGTASSGTKSSLDQKDPWGQSYVYEFDATNKDCIIYTGYGDVQNPSTAGTSYVVGRSDKGVSASPVIEVLAAAGTPAP